MGYQRRVHGGVKNVNLLLEKDGHLAKNWFIWFKPACTAQSAIASSIIWFKRPDEPYIHGYDEGSHKIRSCTRPLKFLTEALTYTTLLLRPSKGSKIGLCLC